MSKTAMDPRSLRPGQFVTVLEWTNNKYERSCIGKPLKVLAVDLPFVAVSLIEPPNDTLRLDTRRVLLREITEEYANAKPGPDVTNVLVEVLRVAVARIEVANVSGRPILSAWLPDARAAIAAAENC